VVDGHVRHGRVRTHGDAVRLGGADVADRDLRRIEVHVIPDPQDRVNAIGAQERVQAVGLL
jgi:hypothetical protein